MARGLIDRKMCANRDVLMAITFTYLHDLLHLVFRTQDFCSDCIGSTRIAAGGRD